MKGWIIHILLAVLVVLAPTTPYAADSSALQRLSEEERTFLEQHTVLTVSINETLAPYTFIEDGEAHGYWVDLLGLLFEGLPVALRFHPRGTQRDYGQMLDQRRVDVLTSILALPYRRQTMLLSDPVINFGYPTIIMESHNAPLTELSALSGKKIAMVKGHPFERELSETAIDIQLVEAKTLQEALEMVAYGYADATLQDNTIASYFIEKLHFTNLRRTGIALLPGLAVESSCFAVAKDRRALHGLLNALLGSIKPEEKLRLRAKWFIDKGAAGLAPVPLSAQESAWIQKTLSGNSEITFCVDPGWMPMEMIDSEGVHIGMIADMLQEVTTRLGVPMKLVPTTSWSQSLQYARSGACTLLTAAGPTPARMEYLDFTEPYGEFPLVVAVSDAELFVEDLSALGAVTLGVVKDFAHRDLIQEKYPEVRIVEVANVMDGLEKVKENKIFGYVDILPVLSYHLRRYDVAGVKIGGKLDMQLQLSMAAEKGKHPELLSILNKVLQSFSNAQKKLIIDKWLSMRIEKVADYSKVWRTLAVAALVVLLIIYWNRKLARLNRIIADKESLLRSVLDSTRDGILAVDKERRVTHSNKRFQEMWNLPGEVLDTQNDRSFLENSVVLVKDTEAFLQRIEEVYASADISNDLLSLIDGSFYIRHSRPLIHEGQLRGRVWTFEDITDKRIAEQKLLKMATTDPLTGVNNRQQFTELGGRELAAVSRHARRLALLMLDLDHFKKINDGFGHAVGDKALQFFAEVCLEKVRAQDILGRLGGEEFAILLPDTDAAQAEIVAERIRTELADNTPVSDSGVPAMTVSIGIAMAQAGDTLEMLLHRADAALYEAKGAGRNCVRVFRETDSL